MSAKPDRLTNAEAIRRCDARSKDGSPFVVSIGANCIYTYDYAVSGTALGDHCGHRDKHTGHIQCCVCGLFQEPLLEAMRLAAEDVGA